MKKIGMVCYPTYGGSGIVATELGMHLANRGHEVHFISYGLPARLDITLPNVYYHQVNIQTYPLFDQYQPYTLALSTIIVDLAQRIGLDILHVHYAIPHAYAAYFSKQILKEKGIYLPVITTLHGTDITLVGKNPVYQPAVEFSIDQSDAVTSVSESLKQDTYKTFNITKDIITIPNFINNSLFHFKQPCRRSNFAESHEKILIHVSNLRKVKRPLDVIEIFNIVQQKLPSKLIIVGEGPELNEMEQLIAKYHLSLKIKIIGQVTDLYPILCMSDLFLLPSEHESFGLAALEAMAAGVPVISSNAGGIQEVNVHDYSGYIADIGNIETMASFAINLLSDDKKLSKFKKQAKEVALNFDKNKIIPLYEKLYEEVYKKNQPK